MKRLKITGPAGVLPAGHTVLLVSGPKGAVTLEAWADETDAHGVLVIHRPEPMHESQRSCPCEYLPDGFCYSDQSFTVGQEEAPSILAGYDARGWVTLLGFYKERIDPDGEDS